MIKQGLIMGGRALSTYVMALVMSFLLCANIGPDAYWLQVMIDAALLAGMGFLMLNDGGYRGERASTMSATVQRLEEEGHAVAPEMRAKCFDKRVALIAFLTAVIPLFAVAGVNLIAEPHYPPVVIDEHAATLEDQAAAYEAMTEEERAQAQAQAEAARRETNPYNVVARAVFMPFVAVYRSFNLNPHGLNLLFLLFALVSPVPEAIGYLMGPGLRKKKLMDIERGKKRKLKKLKVNQKARTPKPPKMEV